MCVYTVGIHIQSLHIKWAESRFERNVSGFQDNIPGPGCRPLLPVQHLVGGPLLQNRQAAEEAGAEEAGQGERQGRCGRPCQRTRQHQHCQEH